MHKSFPLRPRPQEKESVIGYILRIANKNGSFPLRTIFKAINHRYTQKCFEVASRQFHSFISAIAPFLQLSEQHLHQAFQHIQYLDVDNQRLIKNIATQNPKVCVACLQQSTGYHRHYWQLIHNTHCNVHNTVLIHQCPSCQNNLCWNSDLLDGCATCGLRWTDYSIIPSNALPLYQVIANRLTGSSLKSYLNALYLAVKSAAAPQSFMLEATNKYPYPLDEAENLLERGYWLLAHQQEANAFTQTIINEMASQQSFFNREMVSSLAHPITKLPKMQLPLLCNTPNMKVSAHQVELLSDEQASKLLGITPSELNELAKSNSIAHSKSKLMSVYQLKHLDKFMFCLLDESVALLSKPDPCFISIASLSKISHKFLFNFGDSVKLLLKNGINFYYLPEPKTLKDIFVEKSSVLKLLQENESSQFTRLLSMAELVQYFGVQHVKIRQIAKIFNWKKVRVNRSSQQYQPKEIAAFVEGYLLLDKWCDQQVYPKSSLYQYLLNHNIKPIDNIDGSTIKLHIFKKSEVLFSTIGQFEKDWAKSKSPYQLRDCLNIAKPHLLIEPANQNYFLTESPSIKANN